MSELIESPSNYIKEEFLEAEDQGKYEVIREPRFFGVAKCRYNRLHPFMMDHRFATVQFGFFEIHFSKRKVIKAHSSKTWDYIDSDLEFLLPDIKKVVFKYAL